MLARAVFELLKRAGITGTLTIHGIGIPLDMVQAIAISQLLVLAAIIAFAWWRRRKAGRSTYLNECLFWLLLTLDVTVYALYGSSLRGDEAKQWQGDFPDGTWIVFFLFIGVVYAVIIGPFIELCRYLGRYLAKRDKQNLQSGKIGD